MDTFEDEKNYFVVAELPGIEKEGIKLELENSVLTIDANRETGKDEDKRSYLYSRSVTIGDDVDREKVSAKLDNGLLTVTLPKAAEHQPRAIEIR